MDSFPIGGWKCFGALRATRWVEVSEAATSHSELGLCRNEVRSFALETPSLSGRRWVGKGLQAKKISRWITRNILNLRELWRICRAWGSWPLQTGPQFGWNEFEHKILEKGSWTRNNIAENPEHFGKKGAPWLQGTMQIQKPFRPSFQKWELAKTPQKNARVAWSGSCGWCCGAGSGQMAQMGSNVCGNYSDWDECPEHHCNP